MSIPSILLLFVLAAVAPDSSEFAEVREGYQGCWVFPKRFLGRQSCAARLAQIEGPFYRGNWQSHAWIYHAERETNSRRQLTPLVVVTKEKSTVMRRVSDWARGMISGQVFRLPRLTASLLSAVSLGQLRWSESGLIAAMKGLGLYHLMVVSGLHVTVASMLMVRFIASLALVLNVVLVWFGVRTLPVAAFRPVSATLASGVFLLTIGNGAPAQRAFVCFIFGEIGRYWGGRTHSTLFIAPIMQLLLFPQAFWTVSNGLSWTAYLVLKISHYGLNGGNFRSHIRVLLRVNLLLSLTTIAWIGIWCPLSIIANIALVVVGPVLVAVIGLAQLGASTGVPVWSGFDLSEYLLNWLVSATAYLDAVGLGQRHLDDWLSRSSAAVLAGIIMQRDWLRRRIESP